MSVRIYGIGAAPGRVRGQVRRVAWEIPAVPHRTIRAEDVEAEVERFQEARRWAIQRIREVGREAEAELGDVESLIFESQALMLEDPDLVDGTVSYIRDNFLSAERAFDWRVQELRSQFLDTAHAMAIDRLADLRDIRHWTLRRLLGHDEPLVQLLDSDDPPILAAEEITPSMAVRLDPERVKGLVTGGGSRTAHTAVLARSIGLPAVVGLGGQLSEIADGVSLILDGSTGTLIVEPDSREIESFERAAEQSTVRRKRLSELAGEPAVTSDGAHVTLQASLDQPDDVDAAVRAGAEGVGLFRSEFMVIGRRDIPDEDAQYRAYRKVVRAFPGHDVTLRTFDIGGDKFPRFLKLPMEENPYLGWRAIRVCLELPDLFRNQLRAAVRTADDGRLRILLPFVVSVEEVRRTRQIFSDVLESLGRDPRARDVPLGVMVETPAALEILDLLAPQVDFFSLGSNDLTQYVLAADRGNAKLAQLFDPLHPALVRLYRRARERADDLGLEMSVCGDLASDPIGVAVLVGLGYRKLSVTAASLPEIKEVVRAVDAEELSRICGQLDGAETGDEIRAPIRHYLEGASDRLGLLLEAASSARFSLSGP